jgi:hypothetical protein
MRNGRIGGRTWKYSIIEKPDYAMYTNYHEKAEKVIWYTVDDTRWEFEQYNKSWNILHYIPLVSIWSHGEYYRKYKIFKDGVCIGIVDRYDDAGVRTQKLMVNEQEYFTRVGNTGLIRPGKIYEWTIEDANKQEIAVIKSRRETKYERGVYTVDTNGDLDINIIAMLVMMWDMISIIRPGSGKGVARGPGSEAIE